MTKKLIIALIAVVAVLLGVSAYLIFFMPSEQVYNGVLIEQGLKEAYEVAKDDYYDATNFIYKD